MGIGREVNRQVRFEITPVPDERGEKVPVLSRIHPRAKQVIDPDPGQGAKRDFKRARPIDAAHKRIGGNPALYLSERLRAEPFLLCELERLRQQNQVLVAVQLPNPLVIADALHIEIRNEFEVTKRAGSAAHVVAPPCDRFSGHTGFDDPV